MLTGTNVEEKKGIKHKIQMGGYGLKQAAICKLVAHNKDNIQGIVSRAMFALEEMVGKSMP